MDLFPSLPPESRTWVHIASRRLTEAERTRLVFQVEQFSSQWTSHQRPVRSEYALWDDQILVLAAFVPDGDLSGCGIDKHVHVLNEIASESGFSWTSPLNIAYRDSEDRIVCEPRSQFKQRIAHGELTGETAVFDASVVELADARESGIEKRALDSWHSHFFQSGSGTVTAIVSDPHPSQESQAPQARTDTEALTSQAPTSR